MGLLDIFFPKKCVNCGVFGSYVCANCINKLPVLSYQKCPMCEKRSVTGRTHKRCETAWGMDGLIGGFRHTGVIRKMIRKYKFSHVSDLVGDLSEAMISFADMEILSNKNFSIVTCVPLHSSRLRERGYNQSELIAEKVAEYLSIPFDGGVLERVRKTKVQSVLAREERVRNIKGAFKIHGSESEVRSPIKNKKILLVDDVWTTGSTTRECVTVIKRNGAEEVWGLVMAM